MRLRNDVKLFESLLFKLFIPILITTTSLFLNCPIRSNLYAPFMRHPLSVNFLEKPLSDLIVYKRERIESPIITYLRNKFHSSHKQSYQ